MKIAKALKKKNKLVKELNVLLNRVQSYNSIIEGKKRAYSTKDSLIKSKEKLEELVDLKTKISKANIPIQDKIYRLSELKSMVSHLKNVSTQEGPSDEGYLGRDDKVVNYSAEISTTEKDELVLELEKNIEEIQEELDSYNYTTEI